MELHAWEVILIAFVKFLSFVYKTYSIVEDNIYVCAKLGDNHFGYILAAVVRLSASLIRDLGCFLAMKCLFSSLVVFNFLHNCSNFFTQMSLKF